MLEGWVDTFFFFSFFFLPYMFRLSSKSYIFYLYFFALVSIFFRPLSIRQPRLTTTVELVPLLALLDHLRYFVVPVGSDLILLISFMCLWVPFSFLLLVLFACTDDDLSDLYFYFCYSHAVSQQLFIPLRISYIHTIFPPLCRFISFEYHLFSSCSI